MLSICNVANSAAAGNYYENTDDYYSRDRSPSVWSGSGAAALELMGDVNSDVFRRLLDGQLPGGIQIHHAGENSGRRGGTDLTFSAPKSVSMQALIGADVRLLQAHENAVGKALLEAEALAACRVTENGVTSRLVTGNLVIAQFRHDLSRAADPQMHTHAVVLNATQREDGQWRAVDNEQFYRHKMWLGAYYRSELAKEVQTLGYEVRVTHADGRFELAHIQPAQIKIFSQRSAQIESALLEKGLTRKEATARQLQAAALQTRDSKQDHDRDALRAEWHLRASQADINFKTSASRSLSANLAGNSSPMDAAGNSVQYAAHHLMEREAVVRRIDIERAALERGTGKTDLEAIRIAIEVSVADGAFIRNGERYTTPAAQQREREILAIELAGRGAVKPIMPIQDVRHHLADTLLNDDQKEVVQSILCSKNRITGVQGSAGTGKTTALRSVQALAEANDLKTIGIAPSAGAARELAGSGIQSQTLASLAARDYAGLDAKTLLVFDEAGMASAGDMHKLLIAADQANARVVLVGDTYQLKAIQAGRPFAQLQQAGMQCAQLTEIQRQKVPNLREAIELAAAGAAVDSLDKLQSNILEIPAPERRHKAIAHDYAALTVEDRKNTIVVSGTNQGREAINLEVRAKLGLEGKGELFSTLSNKNLTRADALRTVSYQPGDVVRAERNYKSLGLLKGELATVVDGPAGFVMLQKSDKSVVAWKPVQQPNMQVFALCERELAPGDMVRLTENNYKAGIVNGDKAQVICFDKDTQVLHIQKLDGSPIELSTTEPLHLQHGYCQTVHAAQGQTCERILMDIPASSATSNESSYYVAISRATREVTLYTDDRYRLPQALSREDVKTAALELPEVSLVSTKHDGAEMDMV